MAKQKKQPDKRIKEIIRYNVSRKYFGDWTPDELNDTYISENPVSLRIGVLSVDDICDALWNEMSYNPVRFGTKSPFEFDGKNSLESFIDTAIDLDNRAFRVLSLVQSRLSKFWKIATKYDSSFATHNRLKSNCVTITTTISTNPKSKPIPSATYIMLTNIRRCIKDISSQNLRDFGRKTYKQQIIDTFISRHPDLIRPIKIENFAAIKRLSQNPELQQYLHIEYELETAIYDKNSEIIDTQSRIDTLNNEFENPGDTTEYTFLLQKQNEELENLENKLENIKQKILNITGGTPYIR